jgi:NAD(P)-dependent dehydrogenase (short-subunit alcohol dehydrogenase family)
MPPEKELSRKVAVVVGASPGIGRAIAVRLAQEGAHVVVADVNRSAAEETAAEVGKAAGRDTAVPESVDCSDRESMRSLLERAALAYGGIDILLQTAALFFPPGEDGRVTDDQWRRTLDVNLTGSYIAAEEAYRLMREQGTEGSIVLLSSANAVVPKKGSAAYDAGKAALSHLVRELAIEYAPNVRVNAVAPASVVEGSVQFPRERVMTSLAKYGISFDESESTDSLRERLSDYYAQRTLLKRKVSPAEVAQAVFLLASNRLPLTTGHILPVDAGLPEAFLR